MLALLCALDRVGTEHFVSDLKWIGLSEIAMCLRSTQLKEKVKKRQTCMSVSCFLKVCACVTNCENTFFYLLLYLHKLYFFN